MLVLHSNEIKLVKSGKHLFWAHLYSVTHVKNSNYTGSLVVPTTVQCHYKTVADTASEYEDFVPAEGM